MAPPRSRTALGLAAAFVTGGFIVAQARVNAELGTQLGDGVLAAVISFGLGLVLLLVLMALVPAGRRGLRRVGAARRRGSLRPWQLLGGLGGAMLVAGQGLTAHVLGTALFTIAVVAGQSSGGLVVDRVGLGPAGPQATTLPRIVGAVLMLGAVVLSVAPSVSTEAPVALALLPLVAGVAIATQQGLNGRVAAAAGGDPDDPDAERGSVLTSVLPAATINFIVGFAALVLAGVVAIAVLGPPNPLPTAWYLYLGGPFGAVFIGLSAWVVGQIGVLLLSLAAVAGQVVFALLLDVVLPSAAGAPGLTTVLGAALTLVAAGVAAAPWRARRRARAGR
ncbi:DMT family transporter [Actinomycetospora cinnamomea]|uniref:Transporter family-2 protein n=1 Tax=Actinomycetospora cinnamomea TaxID=663609 RepID=A0A2U1F6X6_9PSEU|nr:DMT family transporter [Actinomycetospora cinnamomea]PVZ07941.1 transporter family-2 protein [Actinomycetospora cinnamomea]